MEPKTNQQGVPEFFNAYHALQYDRMSKLESQENYVTTFVTGISAATIAISLDNSDSLTIVTGLFVPLAFFFLNLLAIVYIRKTRKFIKLHQKRAEEARRQFAPSLNDLQKSIYNPTAIRASTGRIF
jgi:hypothetical protein